MDPVSLAIFGGLALLALRKPGTQATPQQPTQPQLPPANDTVKQVTDVIKGGALIAGAALSGAEGLGISLPTVSTVAGVALPVIAITGGFVAGFTLGQLLDKLFGGKAGGVTSWTASVGLGTATAGSIALGLFGGASVVTSYMPPLLFAAVFVYALATIFSDIDELAHGKERYRQTAIKTWRDSYDQYAELFARPTTDGTVGLTGDPLKRSAAHAADGYLFEWNNIQYQIWMRKPHGIGVSNAYHAQWGLDRGYFLGTIDWRTGALTPPELIQLDWNSQHQSAPEYYSMCRRAQSSCVYGLVPTREQTPESARPDPTAQYRVVDQLGRSSTATANNLRKCVAGVDQNHVMLFDAGAMHANVVSYVKWMQEKKDPAAGLREGAFEGDVDAAGRLTCWGQRWDATGVRA